MIRIFSSENRLEVQQIKDLLESKQIDCFIKNEFAIGAVGELSPFDAWPEVWILDSEWEPKARAFIDAFLKENEEKRQQGDWVCPHCHEVNDAHFEICWSCGCEMVFQA
ncbi:putative signal transducing protein [Alteromonas sp. a30]|uniref:putative signal transducing protein n=1 Tax=Alteromonas sp. a30 TaxID=2730917 RepID=UPI00227EFD0F|nr:DUF2007 domain-containing protein [Alteromonas sp. a30]MCY7296122.1 DUF2007 domain-containing protein [Alteromonas sp. a30]